MADSLFSCIEKRTICHHRPAEPDCPLCRAGFSYITKFGIGLDAPIVQSSKPNQKDMSWDIVFVRGGNRDRKGDIIEIDGISTKSHFFNRIAMLDHGKYYPLPIGKCSPIGQPDTKENYGVRLNRRDQVGHAKISFWPNDSIAEKIFDGCVKGIFSAGSIGARPIKATILPADLNKGWPGGIHYLELELVEPTITAIPTNQEAVRDYIEMDAVGKSLPDYIRKSLEPFAMPLKAWTTGTGDIPVAEITKDMSATSSSSGGALVKPPQQGGIPTQKTSSPGGPAMIDEQQERKTPPESYAKQVLQKWREYFANDIQDLEYDLGPMDHENVKQRMGEILKKLREMQAETHEAMMECFGTGGSSGSVTPLGKEASKEGMEDELEESELEVDEVGKEAEDEMEEKANKFPPKEKPAKKKKPPFAKTEKSLTADEELALLAKLTAIETGLKEVKAGQQDVRKQASEVAGILAKV